MRRLAAGLVAAVMAGNGLAMLAAGPWWYRTVPGVTGTGPYNAHFVADIGCAFVVAALGLAWFAWRPVQGYAAAKAGTAFLVAHAAVHMAGLGHAHHLAADALRDLPGVYLPALICLWIVLPRPRSA